MDLRKCLQARKVKSESAAKVGVVKKRYNFGYASFPR